MLTDCLQALQVQTNLGGIFVDTAIIDVNIVKPSFKRLDPFRVFLGGPAGLADGEQGISKLI